MAAAEVAAAGDGGMHQDRRPMGYARSPKTIGADGELKPWHAAAGAAERDEWWRLARDGHPGSLLELRVGVDLWFAACRERTERPERWSAVT